MMLFWLSDAACAAIEPHMPKNQSAARRVDNRRVISGILHVLEVGYRWCHCPADYGRRRRSITASNVGHAEVLAQAARLAGQCALTKSIAIDSTYIKAQCAAVGANWGRAAQAIGCSRGGWTTNVHALTDVIGRPHAQMPTLGNVSNMKAPPALFERAGPMRYLPGDKGYVADRLRRLAREAGATPVIPRRRNRKRIIRYHKQRYRSRHLNENAFFRLKDFRRVHTRYDKLAANYPP